MEYILTEKGKQVREDIKSPDGKSILLYMSEHPKVNPDELRLMLNITDAREELSSLERAGFVKKGEEGGW